MSYETQLVLTTGVFCLIWGAGIILSLVRWKQSPRTSLFVLIGLVLISCGSLMSLTRTFLATSEALFALSDVIGRGSIFVIRFLTYGQTFVEIIAWILLLVAIFGAVKKGTQSES